MGQFLQTNGDYNIKTREGARITLDTGAGVGEVRVTGNLLVEGDTLTVSAENLNVNDNIIILNYGETGAGVTLEYSGIQIDRGTATPATFLFDETTNSWLLANGVPPGTLDYSESSLRLRSILTNADTDGGDLTIIGYGTGVMKVAGTLNYEQQVNDDDDIPNKKYVDDAIVNNPTRQIVSDAYDPVLNSDATPSRVLISDVKNTIDADLDVYGDPVTESEIALIIDDDKISTFYRDRATLFDLEFSGHQIFNVNTHQNIVIQCQGTGRLQTNFAIEIENTVLTPATNLGTHTLYTSTEGAGATGVFFAKKSNPDPMIDLRGELISKNKALVFSMIF